MSTTAPERALRRLVADLARAAPDDIEAVLGGLEANQRSAVEALLASYRGEPADRAPAAPSGAAATLEGLSPWLAVRLERRSQTRDSRPAPFGELVGSAARDAGLDYSMTEAAFDTLKACATTLDRTPQDSAPAAAGRVRDRLFGRRARS